MVRCEWLSDGFRLRGAIPVSCLGWERSGLFECALHVGSGGEYVYTPLFGSSCGYASVR